MTNYIVEEAAPADLMQINALFREIDALHHAALPHMFKLEQEIQRPDDHLKSFMGSDEACFLVARADNRVIGLANMEIRTAQHPLFKERKHGHISNIVVAEQYKRQGVGTRLVAEAHNWFASRQIPEVSLTVFSFNKEAMAFYKSLGFAERQVTMAYELRRIKPIKE